MILSLLLAVIVASTSVTSQSAEGRGAAVVRRYAAPEAGQAVAVDATHSACRRHPFSVLVRYDRDWREQESWAFPAAVVARWDGMSSSGGVWGADGLLYTSGHHSTELYVLQLPKSGAILDLVRIVAFESEGQGIALDASTGLLWSIQRKTREVLVSKLP